MNLTLSIKKQDTKSDIFIQDILLPYMEDVLIALIDRRKLIIWDEYFKDNDLGWITYKNKTIRPTAYETIITGIKNLKTYKYPDQYIIKINPNKILPKSSAKLNDICNLINYGNLSLKGYPIFSEGFEIISKQVPYLYEAFLEE